MADRVMVREPGLGLLNPSEMDRERKEFDQKHEGQTGNGPDEKRE